MSILDGVEIAPRIVFDNRKALRVLRELRTLFAPTWLDDSAAFDWPTWRVTARPWDWESDGC